jgi:hypothetical protein
MTRQQKTPAQRAQEALDLEERRVTKLGAKKAKAQTELDDLTRQHDAAVARYDYLRLHPDLPPQTKASATPIRPTSRTSSSTPTGGTTR